MKVEDALKDFFHGAVHVVHSLLNQLARNLLLARNSFLFVDLNLNRCNMLTYLVWSGTALILFILESFYFDFDLDVGIFEGTTSFVKTINGKKFSLMYLAAARLKQRLLVLALRKVRVIARTRIKFLFITFFLIKRINRIFSNLQPKINIKCSIKKILA